MPWWEGEPVPVVDGGNSAALAEEQGALKARAEAYGKLINEITGLGIFVRSAAHMAEAEDRLKGLNAEDLLKRLKPEEIEKYLEKIRRTDPS